MQLSDLRLPPVPRSFARAVRASCLGVALFGLAAAPLAAAPTPDASPAPLLDKPLPPSATDAVDDQPSPQHVYVSGHWTWKDGAYTWVGGAWELPPSPTAEWVGPRWEKKDSGYVLIEGVWQEGGSETADAPAADTDVVLDEAPPPPEREVIVARPSPAHVWIGGYWGVHAGRRVWVSGRWDLPPRANVVWVSPRWERHRHRPGYVFRPGYWRDAHFRPRTTVVFEHDGWRSDGVVVVTAPPPPRRYSHHYRPMRPSYEHVWIDGYWGWYSGRHVWIEGCWRRPPHGHSRWISPRWERRKGGYIFIEGRWR